MERFLAKGAATIGKPGNAIERKSKSQPKQQRLSNCKKVVKLKASKFVICPKELKSLQRTLESPRSTPQELLVALRHLDCLQLHLRDLQDSQIARPVKKLRKHSSVDVQVLSRGIVEKWRKIVLSETS